MEKRAELNLHAATTVATAIKSELETLQALHLLLQQEHSALIQGDVDLLLKLVPRKNELLEQLSSLSNTRSRDFFATGHENTPAGMEAWLKNCGADGQTRENWNKLITLAREADQLNRDNGILIETSLRHNQQALAVLQAAANPGTGLYGRNGQISGIATGRPIDKV